MLAGKRILLIISGGIAAYKSLDLIRRLRERGASVRCVLTKGGAEFVTPLSVAALSEDKVYTELFSLTDESEMGHIRLSREADLVIVAPLSANLLARVAQGRADDLASAVLLATDKPVLIAPAMNHRMWTNAATQSNLAIVEKRGLRRIGPNEGAMACGEEGPGRMAEIPEIVSAVEKYFATDAPLSGRRALVTSGPTQEPIDPVRFIANRSSGKQGHAVAAALARLGAETILVAGPTSQPDPPGVSVVRVETAAQMLEACKAALPVDIAVCAAAVADWRPLEPQSRKIKKKNGAPPAIALTPNPDILAALSASSNMRPRLVIGFAAETEPDAKAIIAKATAKRAEKGCDWIVANDVGEATGTFGGDENAVHVIDEEGATSWPRLPKVEVAQRIAERIAGYFARIQ